MASEIEFVFFDIGGTLGNRDATGRFTPFPSSAGLLRAMREQLGVRVGVITNLGTLTNDDALALLSGADLAGFIAPGALILEHDAGTAKPTPAIYRFAAQRVGVPVGWCLYVGENLVEVIGAITAGMKAFLKPCPPGRELPG